MTLSTIGAGIVSVNVPDREGRMADVVLGYADPDDYMADGPCSGKIPGRFANRIAKGRFTVGGREYQLAILTMGRMPFTAVRQGFRTVCGPSTKPKETQSC